jgi:hypothetical protein
MIDKYGEAVFGDEARAALQHACDATGAHVKDYHVAPIVGSDASGNGRPPAGAPAGEQGGDRTDDRAGGQADDRAGDAGEEIEARSPSNRPGHQWLIEFTHAPDDVDAFARAIDDYLQDANRHYQIRREAQAFAAPQISPLPDGAFYDWLKATKDNISGQTKVPRMSEERDVADGVLATLRQKH